MHKPELAAAMAEKADLSQTQAQETLNTILDEITLALSRGDSVTLMGFGTFECRQRAAKKGRNPQTGEAIDVQASNNVAFKASKKLKEAVE